jgi:hypothetical protein
MISGNLHADVEQLYLDSGVVKVRGARQGRQHAHSTPLHMRCAPGATPKHSPP